MVSLLAAIIGYIFTRDTLSSVYILLGTFLTWSLARELDPYHEYSAFLCVAFSIINIFNYEQLNILILVWILLIMRMVNGISGKKISYVDVFSVLGLSLFISLSSGNGIYIVLYIIAMMFLKAININPKLILWAGMISAVIFIGGILSGYMSLYKFDFTKLINSLSMLFGVITFIFINLETNKYIEDDRGRKLARKRITLGQLFYGFTVFFLLLFQDVNFNNQVIYLSLIVGTLIYSLIYNFLANKNTQVK